MEPDLIDAAATAAHVAVANLSKCFGALTVLDSVDLGVDRGALVTLLGPSGCGKTTLLRLIAGLATPDKGDVWISGRRVTGTPPHKRNVGVVFQSYALFPHLTVSGNVGFGLSGRGLGREEMAARVGRALDLVQMGQFKGRAIGSLSGGQQQRVALARALAVEPRVLLFDEALSALDRSLRETMQSELRRLLKTIGATAIFVTHDQSEALTMSDKVAVMNAGRIEQYAEPQRVYARPATLFAMRFVGVASEAAGVVAEQCGRFVRVETPIGVIRAMGDHPAGSAVVVATRPEQVKIAADAAGDDPSLNQTEGRIRQAIFQGSRTRLSVALAGGVEFTVEIAGAVEPPGAEGTIRLVWPAEETFAYAA